MIILASQSEARRRLLEQAGVDFVAEASSGDEELLKSRNSHLAITDLTQHLATAKSLSLSHHFPQAFIIGADQTLSCDGCTLNKPKNIKEARLQLQFLRGKIHSLHSAVSVTLGGKLLYQYCDTAHLTMRDFTDSYLDIYLQTTSDDILHCVGCYQIEGAGVNLFSRVEGDYFTIQGLPLLPLLAFLREVGEVPS